MPIASGRPEMVDALVELMRCGPEKWQATTGLQWAEYLIDGRYAALDSKCWHLSSWLEAVRSEALDDDAMARWHRIIHGLAAEGDRRAARLQQADE
jgi:hypothetical protein